MMPVKQTSEPTADKTTDPSDASCFVRLVFLLSLTLDIVNCKPCPGDADALFLVNCKPVMPSVLKSCQICPSFGHQLSLTAVTIVDSKPRLTTALGQFAADSCFL